MASSVSSNDAVADYMQRLYALGEVRGITANVFTGNRDVIEAIIGDNNVDGELWSKNDFVTMENELADDEGRRVSSIHTTTLAVKNSTLTSPFFDSDTGELENAMVVQGNVPASVYLDQTSADLDTDIQAALAKQLSFGLDSAAGVMKNCIAAHNVIHSLLLSALVYFRAKIVESGSSLADNEEGKIMTIYRIAHTLAEISSLVQEAKKVSYNLANETRNGGDAVIGEKYIDLTELPVKCIFCNDVDHGPTPIVGQFSDRLRREYIKRNGDIIKKKRNDVQRGGLTDFFITSGANIASKAASTAIQHNYAVNTGERSSIECAFKRAKFDSQVGHLMESYMDSRIRQNETSEQSSCVITDEVVREHEEKAPIREEKVLSPERDNAIKIVAAEVSLSDENKEEQSVKQNLIMQRSQNPLQLAPESSSDKLIRPPAPQRQESTLPAELTRLPVSPIHSPRQDSALPPGLVEMVRPPPPPVSPIHSPRQESALPPGLVEMMRPLPPPVSPIHSPRQDSALPPGLVEMMRPPPPPVSPIHSPRQDSALPPGLVEMMRLPPPPVSPIHSPRQESALPPGLTKPSSPPTSVGSVLEPSQSETERIASEIRRLEMLGYSPSLPAIRGRDHQNRASMKTTVKKFDPRGRYK